MQLYSRFFVQMQFASSVYFTELQKYSNLVQMKLCLIQ